MIILPYKLTVTMTSEGPNESGDIELYQAVTIEEYSKDPALHIHKNMAFGAGIMGAAGQLVDQAKADIRSGSTSFK